MHFSFVTYNILADSYIRPAWYPNTPAKWLDGAVRHEALLAEIIALNTDVIALQEVEQSVFDLLIAGLGPHGFMGCYGPKGRAKPDGCATFVRTDRVSFISEERLEYPDGSGHIALISIVEVDGRRLGVANTHLKWAPPNTRRLDHAGAHQADALAAATAAHALEAWIACGDMNCTPESPVLDGLRAAGFHDAHAGVTTPTCNANREARKLDHVFITNELLATPKTIAPIDADTPLPSATHPSDHLPVNLDLHWRPAHASSAGQSPHPR